VVGEIKDEICTISGPHDMINNRFFVPVQAEKPSITKSDIFILLLLIVRKNEQVDGFMRTAV
jgi:hypothetical protein